MTHHTYNVIEPYMVDFHIYFTDDPKALGRRLVKQHPDPTVADEITRDWLNDDTAAASVSAGMMGKKKDTFGIIAIFDTRVIKDNTYSYFVHEVIHILSHVIMWTGLVYDPKNDEHVAYFTDYVFRMIQKAYDSL